MTFVSDFSPNRKCNTQDGGIQTRTKTDINISTCRQDIGTKSQLLNLCVIRVWRPTRWIFYFHWIGTWFVSTSCWLARHRKHISSCCNHIYEYCISRLAANILDFLLQLEKYVIYIGFVGLPVPENIRLAVGIVVLLSCIRSAMCFQFGGRHLGINSFGLVV